MGEAKGREAGEGLTMAVYKRGGVYWYEFGFKGARVRETTRQGNKAVALQIMAAHRTRLAKGEVGILEKTAARTLAEFAPAFLAAIETDCSEKPATISFYKSKLKALLAYGPLADCPVDQVDEALVDAFKENRARQRSRRKRALAPGSVNRELATLRRLLRLAHRRKLITTVPKIKMLDGEHEREFVLNPELEKLYLGAAPADLADVAALMLDTGLRVGEAINLEWPQVHLPEYLKVLGRTSKNSKPRAIPLTKRAAEVLYRRGAAKAGYVFHRGDGTPLYQTWLNQQHAEVRKRLKLPADFVPHSFRHTFGTRLGEAGADAFTIMRLMGHSTVTVSQKYVHPTPETLERAIRGLEALNQRKAVRVPTISTTGKSEDKAKGPVTN